jgi:hypothetical protein
LRGRGGNRCPASLGSLGFARLQIVTSEPVARLLTSIQTTGSVRGLKRSSICMVSHPDTGGDNGEALQLPIRPSQIEPDCLICSWRSSRDQQFMARGTWSSIHTGGEKTAPRNFTSWISDGIEILPTLTFSVVPLRYSLDVQDQWMFSVCPPQRRLPCFSY